MKTAYEKSNENLQLRFFSKNKINSINIVTKLQGKKEKKEKNINEDEIKQK